MSKCTLADVAKACNVSRYTVSRAINDKKDISKETKEMILTVAKEMGYIVNMNARNLRIGSTKNIAIIYDDFENPYYNMIIKELAIKLNERNYSITLFYDFDSISLVNTGLLKRVLSSNIDGIISFIGLTDNAKKLNEIWKKPMVQLSRSTKIDIDQVYFDNENGGYIITKHLIEQGYKKIGFLALEEKVIGVYDRTIGYRRALKECNIDFDENMLIELADEKITFEDAVDKLIEHHADSIICYSDILAFKVLKLLKDKNLNIKVTGFDNIQQSLNIPVDIATVAGSIEKLVDSTIDIIFSRINEPQFENFKTVVIPVHIID